MVQCYTENLHFLIDHIPLHQIGQVNTETLSAVPLFFALACGCATACFSFTGTFRGTLGGPGEKILIGNNLLDAERFMSFPLISLR